MSNSEHLTDPETPEIVGDEGLIENGLYAQIVNGIRDSVLRTNELAEVVGVAPRQITNWASGTNTPSGLRRDRLLEVHWIVTQLREVYTREGAEIWLHGRKKSLDGARPIDLLRDGKFETVLMAIDRLRQGAA